jgi:ribosomal-protein-serine acetyltransferase
MEAGEVFHPVNQEMSDGLVLLRPFGPDDAAALHGATVESLDQLMPWMRWCERSFSLADSVAWIEFTENARAKQEAYNFAIIETASGRLAGSIWLSRIQRIHANANLGYWVRTSCAGRGLCTAAGRLVAQFGFQQLGLNRLDILVAVGNRASERVAEKLGGRREGILRERLQLEGQAKDAVMYGLLASDFRASDQMPKTIRRQSACSSR